MNRSASQKRREERDPSATPTDRGDSHSRRRRTSTDGRPAEVVTFDIGSPGGRSSPFRPGSPYEGIPAAPPSGCSTDVLREYSMAFFGHLNAKFMELQRQMAQDHGQFATLHASADNTLEKLKLFETKVNGEVLDSMVKSDINAAKLADLDTDTKELKRKLEGIVLDFNSHVGGNFGVIEEEFRKLQHNLNAVGMFAAAGASSARSSSDGNGSIEQNVQNLASIVTAYGQEHGAIRTTVDGLRLAVNGLIAELGPNGCHCKHVDDIAKELDDTIKRLNILNVPHHDQRITALEHTVHMITQQFQASLGASGGSGGGSGGVPSSAPQGQSEGPRVDPFQASCPWQAGSGHTNPPSKGEDRAERHHVQPQQVYGAPTPHRVADVHRLFDDKVALSESYTFKGGDAEGEKWKKKTRGYFVSKCSMLQTILD